VARPSALPHRGFRQTCKSPSPDTALLAVMEAGSGPATDLAAARVQLATEGIKFELLTPHAYKTADGPYLHFDDEG